MDDVLKPILCATALLGYHILRRFQMLLVDVVTTYEKLAIAFPKLYDEMVNANPEDLIDSNIMTPWLILIC